MVPAGPDIEGIYRREAGRCVATLVRVLGDVDLAEEAVAEAFAVAVTLWPERGVPANPGGWITTTARNRAIDHLRRESTRTERYVAAERLRDDEPDVTPELGDLEVVPDDQLRLIFLCCHPALSPDAQVALTLRLLGGLETAEIARAFLVPEATMAQRLVRAKRKIRDNRIAYRIPTADELPARLVPVLATIYLVFNEGHSATSGDSATRPELIAEAIRLGELLVDLLPDESEPKGLLALMLLTDARRPARTDGAGRAVRLADQDRTRWDHELIERGTLLLDAAAADGGLGPYGLQAAIAATHAGSADVGSTDWARIVALYDRLYLHRPHDVVALNRAIAVAERDGPEQGLAALEGLDLDRYAPFHAARAELMTRIGAVDAAIEAFDVAIERAGNSLDRADLVARRAAVAGATSTRTDVPPD